MSPTETPTQRLATLLLGMPVNDWIAGQRELGRTWREVADRLDHATKHQVVVSHESVRQWADEVPV